MTDIVASRSPFVDGAFVTGAGDPFTITDPGTEATVATVEGASPEQVADAVAAARRAFDTGPWPRMTADERGDALLRFAGAIEDRRDVLTETVISEAGCPLGFTQMMQVGMGLASSRDLVALARSLPEWEHNEMPLPEYVAGAKVRLSIRRYEPVGVVAAITPSNFPFTTNMWKVVPALATGCTVVLRPSPSTPLEATVLGEAAAEADLPAGVLNVVPELGPTGAELLTTHADVDLVTFTGSSAVGRRIGAQAGAGLKRQILELGGKSVQLYLPDALEDGLGAAAMGAFSVFFAHAGQGCSLQTRMLVPAAQKAAVLDAVAATVGGLTIGDTRDASTTLGPVVSAASLERIEGLVASGIDAGGRVVTGGARPASRDRGFYYEATVVDIDDNANPLAQTEVFGPVLTVQGYRDLDEAVAITNDTPYDLSAGVYTRDLTVGLDLTRRIRTGTVQVNTGAANAYTPMGGYKLSGIGRERGVPGIRAFQQAKHVVVGTL
jgi:acyl-CoA reductase-like NAD-dependent aldehyde dehydrogenase